MVVQVYNLILYCTSRTHLRSAVYRGAGSPPYFPFISINYTNLRSKKWNSFCLRDKKLTLTIMTHEISALQKRSMTIEYVFCIRLNIDLYDYDRRRAHILESLKFNYLVAIVRKNLFMGSRRS